MNEMEFLGTLISAVITLGGFIAVIVKFTQPINDLRVVIQKLNDKLDTLEKQSDTQIEKVNRIDGRVDKLENRVGTIETQMKFFHKDN